MEKLHFSQTINAPREKVWAALWDMENYQAWTKPFGEGGYAETDNWREGSEVKFLSKGGGGMLSRVMQNVPNEVMSFQHNAEIKDFEVQEINEKSKDWIGALETYTLSEADGVTTVNVEMDMSADYADYFKKIFPEAMAIVKEIAEK